ncbi:EF-hand domain-containing protein [Ramlibacter sp. AN1133]|uniref:EF-hand domain-containing protein n=1 Tax=Ramlibacter sp. AN1133 TaxID=3133429 RepID=UPI0030C59713
MLASTRLAAALICALAAASAVHAQTTRAPSRVQPATNTIPSSASRIAQTAPRPTGLVPAFPAGLTSGSGGAVSTNPIGQSTTMIPPGGSSVATTTSIPSEIPSPDSTPTTTTTSGFLVPGTTIVTPGTTIATPAVTAAVATNVMGAGATVRGPGQTVGGAGGFSATDQARSFFFADGNHDGDITRAEFGRLSISTMTFEEMDRNYDGVISRFEYEDSMR